VKKYRESAERQRWRKDRESKERKDRESAERQRECRETGRVRRGETERRGE
jgi:hypothetical protein